jgi:hypothetical protein
MLELNFGRSKSQFHSAGMNILQNQAGFASFSNHLTSKQCNSSWEDIKGGETLEPSSSNLDEPLIQIETLDVDFNKLEHGSHSYSSENNLKAPPIPPNSLCSQTYFSTPSQNQELIHPNIILSQVDELPTSMTKGETNQKFTINRQRFYNIINGISDSENSQNKNSNNQNFGVSSKKLQELRSANKEIIMQHHPFLLTFCEEQYSACENNSANQIEQSLDSQNFSAIKKKLDFAEIASFSSPPSPRKRNYGGNFSRMNWLTGSNEENKEISNSVLNDSGELLRQLYEKREPSRDESRVLGDITNLNFEDRQSGFKPSHEIWENERNRSLDNEGRSGKKVFETPKFNLSHSGIKEEEEEESIKSQKKKYRKTPLQNKSIHFQRLSKILQKNLELSKKSIEFPQNAERAQGGENAKIKEKAERSYIERGREKPKFRISHSVEEAHNKVIESMKYTNERHRQILHKNYEWKMSPICSEFPYKSSETTHRERDTQPTTNTHTNNPNSLKNSQISQCTNRNHSSSIRTMSTGPTTSKLSNHVFYPINPKNKHVLPFSLSPNNYQNYLTSNSQHKPNLPDFISNFASNPVNRLNFKNSFKNKCKCKCIFGCNFV